jgi:hypothetical protein
MGMRGREPPLPGREEEVAGARKNSAMHYFFAAPRKVISTSSILFSEVFLARSLFTIIAKT